MQGRSRQSGFTIIEVLCAVGLSSLLMAALYTAMSVYWTSAVESYDEIERAQIARALLRQMARDIQSCRFVPTESTELESEDDLALDDLESVDVDTAMSSYSDGLLGSDTDLVLYISRPDRNQEYVSAQELTDPAQRSSDAMIIRYFLAEEGGGVLSGMMADQASQTQESENGVAGLAKMTGDLLGLSNSISDSDFDMQLNASDMLAREVGAIRFTYFDGVDELEEWDSTQLGKMPLAVVIELTLRTVLPDTEERTPEEIPGYLDETVHRLVVPVPVAEPYVGLE